jgi:hypothetical protein
MRSVVVAVAMAALCAAGAAGEVKLTRQGDRIEVEVGGKPFTVFYAGGEAPKPYLHPLVTATGKRITRAFPMEQVEGETRDHPHHRGLWFTHGDVNGYDFWVNEKSDKPEVRAKRGVIVLQKIEEVKSGKNEGRIRATFEWRSPQGEPLLTEARTMVFHGDALNRMVDFDVTFTALRQVKFGDTKEGFFAIRLRDELTETKGTGMLLNAAGATRMKDTWGKASPWMDYSGVLEGDKVGVAIFDHPGNPKHPTYWHCRDYGLFAANQFGEHDFFRDKTRDGSVTLEPGKSLRFRYRVVVHAGDAKEARVAELYQAYSGRR